MVSSFVQPPTEAATQPITHTVVTIRHDSRPTGRIPSSLEIKNDSNGAKPIANRDRIARDPPAPYLGAEEGVNFYRAFRVTPKTIHDHADRRAALLLSGSG